MKIIFTRLINDNNYISFDNRDNWSSITEDNIIIPPTAVNKNFVPETGTSKDNSILSEYGYRFYRYNYRATTSADITASSAGFHITTESDTDRVYDNNFDEEVKTHIGKDIENVLIPNIYLKNALGFVCQPVDTYDMATELKVNFSYETENTVVKSLKNVGLTNHGKFERGNGIISLKLTGLTATTNGKASTFKLPENRNSINTDTSLAYLIEYLNTNTFRDQKVDLTPTFFPETIQIGNHFKGTKSLYGISFNQRIRDSAIAFTNSYVKITQSLESANISYFNKDSNGNYVETESENQVTEDIYTNDQSKINEALATTGVSVSDLKRAIINKDNYSIDEEAMLNCSNLQKFYLSPNITRIEHGAFYGTDIDTKQVVFGDPEAWALLGQPYDEDFLLGYKIDVTSHFQYYREMKDEYREQQNNTSVYTDIFKAAPSDSLSIRDGYNEAEAVTNATNRDIVLEYSKMKEHNESYSATKVHKLKHYFNVGFASDMGIEHRDNGSVQNESYAIYPNDSTEFGNLCPRYGKDGKDNKFKKTNLVDIYNNVIDDNVFEKEKTGTGAVKGNFINVYMVGNRNQSNNDYSLSYNDQVSRLYVDYICYKNASAITGATSKDRLGQVEAIISAKTYESMYK